MPPFSGTTFVTRVFSSTDFIRLLMRRAGRRRGRGRRQAAAAGIISTTVTALPSVA
ncbi:MAG: hypothetical protein QM736_21055 [Vicinamibacterales bacterium]